MKEIFDISVDISKDELLKRLGSTSNSALSPRSNRQMDMAIETIHNATNARGVYKTFPVHTDGGSIHLNGEVTFKGKKLGAVLNHCDSAAMFVFTLGVEVDRVIKESAAKRFHYSTVLDAAASVAAESGVQSMQDFINDTLPEDECITKSYSPGYCDWPLSDQGKLFCTLSPCSIGVRLSDEYLMSPRKSISGIIGIGSSEVVDKYGNACLECSRANCPYRRK